MTTTPPRPAARTDRSGVDVGRLTVGVLGGTGPQGRGLALRLALAGQPVALGSRDADRAGEVAAGVAARGRAAGGTDVRVTGGSNLEVARGADLVVVAVPHSGHADTLAPLADALAGKVVVDCVVPMAFDARGAYVLDVPEGSVTEQAAALLPASSVVGAFHHLSAVILEDLSHPTIDADVMVVGDDRSATDTVQALAGRLPGVRGVYAGRLRNARQVEALTANLVSVNRRYKVHAGVRVTDV
ncbi:NADPH-dependent F420 reductase [Blastococcus sp. KM273129]|uniref:NADPH-dependent F420 reductase n=1 Tax=Blastococcus sp. KM273129 TaxID=2570315 RepID=UPI001F032137|nr:NADPH-dependent F420 reductase [Blastococcus sp. KM273129]